MVDAEQVLTPTVEEFLAALRGLLEPADVDSLRLKYSHLLDGGDSQRLAKELVADKVLTKYQAAIAYHGRSSDLIVGPYKILDRLGSGGMGTVFKAVRCGGDEPVALKVIRNRAKSPEIVARFQREARAAAALEHPNIVRALDFGEDRGQHYFAMEFVDGLDLSTLIKKQGPLGVLQAVKYVVQAARGLAYAHQQGIVHRDIKPANLLLDQHGQVRVLDLGLARFSDPSAAANAQAEEGLTQTGQVMGTIDYMAPEQAFNTRLADARADVYGLGCTLYRLLTGQRPYSGESIVEKILAHREQPIPFLRALRSDVPETLDRVFHRAVAKRPEDRYQTMAEFADDLERSLQGAESISTSAAAPSTLLPRPVSEATLPAMAPIPVAATYCSAPQPSAPAAINRPSAAFARRRLARQKGLLSRTTRFLAVTAGGIILVSAIYGMLILFGGHGADFLRPSSQSSRTGAESDAGVARMPRQASAANLRDPQQSPFVASQKPATTQQTIPLAARTEERESTNSTVISTKPASNSAVPAAVAVVRSETPLPATPSNSTKASTTETASQKLREARKKAIDDGLNWLAAKQLPDGSWECKTGPDGGDKKSPCAATGLVVCAMLRAGHTHQVGEFHEQVDKGLRYLIVRQNKTNSLTDDGKMYSQGMAALALCEICRRSDEERFVVAAQRAINYIVLAQDPKGGGWRYAPREPGDTSVTGWQVQALSSAKEAKLRVPERTLAGATYFFQQLQRDRGTTFPYMAKESLVSPSMSAAGLYSTLELGAELNDPNINEGALRLVKAGVSADAYRNYYVTRLVHKLGGAPWNTWDDQISQRLIDTQESVGTLRGSWDPNRRSMLGEHGGRLGQTAFHLLILLTALE